ncbi:MAG: fibronectin type III domain-containing protein, partial [Elusimicrobiota bacterium]|nr:fibronectin type III domain-containing protein [Elusimicrobiota bacterium]
YIFGGFDGANKNEIVEYDPATDTRVTKSATLPTARTYTSAAYNPKNGKIYIFGGFDGANKNEIVEYDAVTDVSITKSATLPTARIGTSAAYNPKNGKIYIFGGEDVGANKKNEIVEYDPVSDSVLTKSATLPTGRLGTSAAYSVKNGKIYIFGGNDSGGNINEIVEYDPATDVSVTKSATLPTGRYATSAGGFPGKSVEMSGLTPNTRYYFRVKAHSNSPDIYSNYSNELSTYTRANPPLNSSVLSVSSVAITIQWSANGNPNWTRWGILRSTESGWTSAATLTTFDSNQTATTFVAGGLQSATTYWFKVQAFNGDGIATAFDAAVSTITLSATVIVPTAPTGLTATEVTNSSIKWVWNDTNNEDGYRVKTSTDGVVADLSANTVNYAETGLLPNTQYSRYVEAYNAGGMSTSTVVSKYTLAASPATFVVSAKDYNFVSISWLANGNPAGTNYELSRSTDSGFTSAATINLSTSTSYTDTGLSQLTTYYYRLYSVNAESVKTGPATLTVQTLNSVIKGPINGKVTQADGTVAFPVLVQLFNNEGTIKIAEIFNKSDDGSYLFENLDDGIYRVVCSWLVNEIESVVYKTDIPENSINVLFTLEIKYDTAFLSGKITLGSRANFVSGKFAPAQQPYVELGQRGRVIAKIDADTSGNYTIPNLLPGKYVVRAFNGVQMSEPSEVQVKEGEKVMLNFKWALGLVNENVYAFPNPTKIENITIRYSALNTNHTAKIRLYNIAGELVRVAENSEITATPPVYKFVWDLKNEDGDDVASGVYIYILDLKETDTGEKATVKKKLAIIK